MIRRKDLLKVLLIIPITLFRRYDLLLPGVDRSYPVAEMFLQNIFSGNPSREDTDIVIAIFGLLEVVIFNLLFGAYVYHDLYENSAYVFVRQKSRGKWFGKRAAELFLFSALYHLLLIGLTFLLCMGCSEQGVDSEAVRVLIITYVMILLFTFWTTLLINIVAILTGAAVSFVINYFMLTVFAAVAVNFEKIPLIRRFPVLLKMNPVANVVVNWNENLGKGLQPAVYFIVLCAVTYFAGSILVSKMDISVADRE